MICVSLICFLTVLCVFSTCVSANFLGQSRLGQIGNFSSRIGKKNTFWHWDWGSNSAPKFANREP